MQRLKPAILGIDSLSLYHITHFSKSMPFLQSMHKKDFAQPLKSCHPPITIPAWSVATTGRSPGELGVYGFFMPYSQNEIRFRPTDSRDVRCRRIWEHPVFQSATIINVPQTYPVKASDSVHMVSGILASRTKGEQVFSNSQIKKMYLHNEESQLFDIAQYRSNDKAQIFKQLKQMIYAKQQLLPQVFETQSQLLFWVSIELDRLSHAFLQNVDETHPHYRPEEQYQSWFHEILSQIDEFAKNFWQTAEKSGYCPTILSDHGIQPLHGCFNINRWLFEHELLQVKNPSLPLSSENMCNSSKAWATGGYCGRIYIRNRKDKSTEKKLIDCADKWNQSTNNPKMTLLPTWEIYSRCAKIPPDFLIYMDDMKYRCSNSPVSSPYVIHENDTGPDGANHHDTGIIISKHKQLPDNLQEVYTFLLGQAQGVL
jgi:predicted AlkP superfamily phosphohydrolase/phosphomutase